MLLIVPSSSLLPGNIATSITDQYFTSPAFIGSSEARAQVGNVIVFVLKQEKDGAKALRDALKNCGGNNVNWYLVQA